MAIDYKSRADIQWKFLCMLFQFLDIYSIKTSQDRDRVFMVFQFGMNFSSINLFGIFLVYTFSIQNFPWQWIQQLNSEKVTPFICFEAIRWSFLVNIPMRQCIVIPGHLLHSFFDIIDSNYIQLHFFLFQPVSLGFLLWKPFLQQTLSLTSSLFFRSKSLRGTVRWELYMMFRTLGTPSTVVCTFKILFSSLTKGTCDVYKQANLTNGTPENYSEFSAWRLSLQEQPQPVWGLRDVGLQSLQLWKSEKKKIVKNIEVPAISYLGTLKKSRYSL